MPQTSANFGDMFSKQGEGKKNIEQSKEMLACIKEFSTLNRLEQCPHQEPGRLKDCLE